MSMINQEPKVFEVRNVRLPVLLSELRFACPICHRILKVNDPCECPACGTPLEITVHGSQAIQSAVFGLIILAVSSCVIAAAWSLVLSPSRIALIIVWVLVLCALFLQRRVVLIARRSGRVPPNELVRSGVPIVLAFVFAVFSVTINGC